MARPVNPDTGRLHLNAEPEQLRRWQAAAQAEDLTLTQWLRRVADRAAKGRSRSGVRRG
jgi:hypothetical protein